MNTLTRLTTWAAVAWGAVAPLHAAATPQEIFNRLAEPAKPAPVVPEKRAAALPALALIPAGADMVLASAAAGEDTLELLRLLGVEITDDMKRWLGSVKSVALATGDGADALHSMMPLLLHASQMEQMKLCEESWVRHANPAFADAIHRGFARQMQLQQQAVLSAYRSAHLSPIYYATTAHPGRVADFLAMHRECLGRMQAAAQKDDALTWVEMGGFAGLRLSQLTAYKWIMKAEPQDAAIRDSLAERELYLLTRVLGGAAITVLCERPADVVLPQDALFSILPSSRLDGADAYIDNLRLTGWCSAAFHRALRLGLESHPYPLTLAVLQALGNIAAADQVGEHQPIYQKAAHDIAWLVWQPPFFNEISTPLAVQVWQPQDGTLAMESVGGAQGMDFEQGELHFASQAAAPNAVFYLESTPFRAPHPPHFDDYWQKMGAALMGASQGIAITLRAEDQQHVLPLLRYAEIFRPEAAALCNALQTASSGLGAPFALLAAQEGESTGWAFCAAVRNRASLANGWQQMLNAVSMALGKLGISPELVRALPVSDVSLGGTAREHAIELPGMAASSLPRVAVSDSRFVLGNSAKFNAAVLNTQDSPMNFCGAANAVDIPRLAAALKHVDVSSCSPMVQRIPQVLSRLAERVQKLYSVSVIRDGIRTARGLMMLK